MKAVRRLSIAALVVACTHLVFGAIVRISGSGMGCGDNWPKCYGYWFPPFSRPDLIVEVSHRYLASILTITVLSLAFVAFRNRRVEGVAGRGGPMRSAFGAVAAVFTAAILGGVTVKMGNAPWATVAHWLVAMTLLAMVAMTAIRAGALGGASSLVQSGTRRAARSAFAAAVLAIFAVALGGLTAKLPGAAVGCTTVPLCGPNPAVERASIDVQMTHRTIAVLLVLHLIGVVMMFRKRRATEAPVVIKAAYIALGMVLLQLVVASSMILFHLPPVLRSLHEATGVGIWLSCFTLAYLARRASGHGAPVGHSARSEDPDTRHSERSEEPAVQVPVARHARHSERSEESAVQVPVASHARHSERSEEPAVQVPVASHARHSERSEESAVQVPIASHACHSERSEESAVQVPVARHDDGTPDPSVASLPRDDAGPVASHDDGTPDPSVASPPRDDAGLIASHDDDVASELDWEPKRKAHVDEIDEFSLPPEPKPGFAEPPEPKPVVEEVAAESNVVTPPVEAPKLAPLPPKPAPTMAVIVARGADLL